ncbi:protein SPA [Forsythia ovata]|uniref:Protein SPA n=1 Tax=Forsythia ovata TaxID=205694 RepID=A0ABD1VLK7_9LAMI
MAEPPPVNDDMRKQQERLGKGERKQTMPKLPASYPCVRAVDLDQNTIVAITVGVVSIAVGIGIPVFYENQIDSAAKRENTQPCFPCSGSGAQQCRFCMGSGSVVVELGGDEKEVSRCINCDGVGSLTVHNMPRQWHSTSLP